MSPERTDEAVLNEKDPQERRGNRREIIDILYYRTRTTTVKEAEARPLWMKDVALLCTDIESRQLNDEMYENLSNISSPIYHFNSKLRVISRFPATRNIYDARDMFFLFKSVQHFRSGRGYRRNDGELFTENINDLIQNGGVSTDSVVQLFRTWEGLAAINPALVPTFFSGVEVEDLAGMDGRDRFRGWSKLKREEGRNSFKNMKAFSRKVIETIEDDYADDEDMQKVSEGARHLENYLDLLDEHGEAFNVMRPAKPGSIYTPVAVALGEHFERNEADNQMIDDVAKSLIATIRRGRLALDSDSLFKFLLALKTVDDVDIDTLPDGLLGYASKGLDVLDKLMTSTSPDKLEKIKETISGRVVEKLVLHLRLGRYHLFDWKQEDYDMLGMGGKWNEHEEFLKKHDFTIPGPEIFPAMGILLDGTGQWEPPHVAHVETLRELAQITIPDLLVSENLAWDELAPPIYVGVSVNHGNPDPRKKDWPGREEMLRMSLTGVSNVFVWPQKPEGDSGEDDKKLWDTQGRKSVKLAAHMETLERADKKPYFRMIWFGTDKLNEVELKFTLQEEKVGFEELNNIRPVLALQKNELKEPSVLFERMKKIYENFPTAIVLFPAVPEVHSSYFKDILPHLSDSVLSTLVHPAIIPKLRELQKEFSN